MNRDPRGVKVEKWWENIPGRGTRCTEALRWEARVAGKQGTTEPVGGGERCGVWITRTLETTAATSDVLAEGDGKTLQE